MRQDMTGHRADWSDRNVSFEYTLLLREACGNAVGRRVLFKKF